MTSKELRQKFINFFVARNHKHFPSSPLLDATDPSVLLTTAGMQQFKDYFSSKRDAKDELGSEKVVTVQKCFRTSDINSVGDKDHLTFLEMLGNFSFNASYFKEEAIGLAIEFLEGLGINRKDFQITVFGGEDGINFDEEAYHFWRELGFEESQIQKKGRDDNFWGPTGEEGPCGPTTEIYLDGSEIWNIVFNQYYQDKEGRLTPLAKKGIDTGMGLERLTMAVQKKPNVFETDLFLPLIEKIRAQGDYELSKKNQTKERIIADHIRGAVFLITEGLMPSNLKEGYVLRRVLRRAIRAALSLGLKNDWYEDIINQIISIYGEFWQEINRDPKTILSVIQKEEKNFSQALAKGTKELDKKLARLEGKVLSGKIAFDIYQSCGLPIEMIEELVQEKGYQLEKDSLKKAEQEHKQASKTFEEKKLGGLRENPSYYEIKLHTATHLLHQALRDVLGKKVKQLGSDINEKRLRFDFNFERALTAEEISQIEKIVNQKIKQDLKVSRIEMPYKQAIEKGALAFFKEKYPERVTTYKIHPKSAKNDWYSYEICRGPHIQLTSELKKFIILKQESIGSGVRRIKAKVEK